MNVLSYSTAKCHAPPAVIAFDGDDTLWVDGMREQEWERRFKHLAADRLPSQKMAADFRLLLNDFGFTIDGVQRALLISGRKTCPGKLSMEWLDQVEALPDLAGRLDIRPAQDLAETIDLFQRAGHPLWIITKGDLVRQAIKLAVFGHAHQFSRIEIVSRKTKACYASLLASCNLDARQFIMIGDSFTDDVLPVIRLGARAGHVPLGRWALLQPLEQMTWGRSVAVCRNLHEAASRCTTLGHVCHLQGL
jgi:putative hydrolase of the HAD superfamily